MRHNCCHKVQKKSWEISPKAAKAQADLPAGKPVEADADNRSPAQELTLPVPAVLPDFAFGDGAKEVETGTNAPAAYYKNKSLIE
jgi:hypothetical protein